MRKSHIAYLKDLATKIKISDEFLIAEDKFLEIDPPLDRFQESIPFCVVKYVATTPTRNKRIIKKLSDKDVDGVRNLRFLREHFKTDYRYSLNFWVSDPTKDVVSKPGGDEGEDLLSESDLGIIDQVLLYIAEHERFLSPQGKDVEVSLGRCAIVADPAGEMGEYKVYVEIVFADGLHSIETVPSISGAQ
ncbi:MAG: hypothetical protein K8R21_12440, partial [Leptospira sp.]|nr:hypothetical protein [Leptospira sp.]